MLRFLTALILIGGLAYLVNYFFNTSRTAVEVNGAYREMNQKPCTETSNALTSPSSDPMRKKADIYLSQLAESHYSVVNLQSLNPNQWQLLVQAFQRECGGNPGLPGEEIMARIPQEEILGLQKKDDQ